MRISRFVIMALALTLVLASSLSAGRDRGKKKLPVGAYITQAKIEILSGETERVEAALGYLHDLFEFYGPHSEAYYWVSQIYVDYIEKESGPAGKMPHLAMLAHYADSLRWSCDNEDIKKKYRDGCSDLAETCDSILVKYKREFYNAGVEKLNEIKETNEDMKADPDSASESYYTSKIDALRDTAVAYFELALVVDSTNTQAWIGAGSVLSQTGDLVGANDKLIRGLAGTEGEARETLVRQISNNYISAQSYCEAIPYLREYVDGGGAADVAGMFNLSILYATCDQVDSQMVMLNRVLAVDTNHINSLTELGKHSNRVALAAFDSSKHYSEAGDEASADKWLAARQDGFTAASVYFGRAFAASGEAMDPSVARDYGTVLLLLSDYKSAIEPFQQLAELQPDEKNNWTNLADCYVKVANWDKAARAYEKVVELDADNVAIWKRLKELYRELKETDNMAKAEAHLQ